MTVLTDLTMNDGTTLPAVGYGTYPLKGDDADTAVRSALQLGYRLIDTAVNYRNQEAVGRGIAGSGVPREQIRLATKLPGRQHGYEETLSSFAESRAALNVDYVDLYLIHWPNPSVDKYVDSWKAMIALQQDGLVKSIGVSNFTVEFLDRLAAETGVVPAVNQIELHPFFPQAELRGYHAAHGIQTESWSPLGRAGALLSETVVVDAANRHGVTPAQVVLRWHTQLGAVPIPKSADPARQEQNLNIGGFELSQDELAAITALGRADGRLFGADPNTHEEM